MAATVLDNFDKTSFTHDGATRDVYRAGSGPGIVVMSEMPGITPNVAAFAQRLVDAGFTVAMPNLFGTPFHNNRLWLKVFLDPEQETTALAAPSRLRDEEVIEKGDPGLQVESVCSVVIGFSLLSTGVSARAGHPQAIETKVARTPSARTDGCLTASLRAWWRAKSASRP